MLSNNFRISMSLRVYWLKKWVSFSIVIIIMYIKQGLVQKLNKKWHNYNYNHNIYNVNEIKELDHCFVCFNFIIIVVVYQSIIHSRTNDHTGRAYKMFSRISGHTTRRVICERCHPEWFHNTVAGPSVRFKVTNRCQTHAQQT